METKDLCYIGVFTAIIAVLAQIMIPMAGGVPVTLQTFAVALAGIVLGRKRGTLAVIAYLLLGTVGVPVFAGMTGGLGKLVGMTGGFLFSFPLLAYCAGLAAEKSMQKTKAQKILITALGLAIGAVLNYAVGTLWFSAVSGNSIAVGISACVAPFVVNDIIKMTAAGWIGHLLRRNLKKAGIL